MPRFTVLPIVTLEFKQSYVPLGEVAMETMAKFEQTVNQHGLTDVDVRASAGNYEIETNKDLLGVAQEILDDHFAAGSGGSPIVVGQVMNGEYWVRQGLTKWYGSVSLKLAGDPGIDLVVKEGAFTGFVCLNLDMQAS